MNQKEKVKKRIEEVGFVDNFWAIENYILRLGAIVYELRKEGINLSGAFGKELGKERAQWKDYYYYIKKSASVSDDGLFLRSNDVIKNFQPIFGNENHRVISERIGRLNSLETRDIKTKSNLEEIDRLRKDIIWRINQNEQ